MISRPLAIDQRVAILASFDVLRDNLPASRNLEFFIVCLWGGRKKK